MGIDGLRREVQKTMGTLKHGSIRRTYEDVGELLHTGHAKAFIDFALGFYALFNVSASWNRKRGDA